MQSRHLGTLEVPPLGLGAMGMSIAYGPVDHDEAVATLHAALDAGAGFVDTADCYGAGANERLVGDAIAGRRDEVVLATKFGILADPATGMPTREVDGRPEYLRRCLDASLTRLGVDHVDLYYQHRPDPGTPIEETVGAMAELVEAGKVRCLGLSDASAATVRRAAAVAPIAAVQTEWSLFARDIEDSVLPTCRDLGIGVVPYSPLGRGILTDASMRDLPTDDVRRGLPWFSADNLALVSRLREIAARRGATPAQVALAWLIAQDDGRADVVPIPGTKRPARLAENLGALALDLTPEELATLSSLAPAGDRVEDRSWVERDTVPPR